MDHQVNNSLIALLATITLSMASCRTLEPVGDVFGLGPDARIFDAATMQETSIDAMADAFVDADVVFLGEEHDNDVGHSLQHEAFVALLARRPDAALSLEMVERDDQATLDRWLADEIDDATLAAEARLWPKWDEHYLPVVIEAKERGLPVIAGNVPRPLASRVSKEGLAAVAGEEHMPRSVEAETAGEYYERFLTALGTHPAASDRDWSDFYAAQCVKDDAMAESIADHLAANPGRLIVHLCGKFHSDFGLGTVERLRSRMPAARIAIASMASGSRYPENATDDDWARGDTLWLVRAQ